VSDIPYLEIGDESENANRCRPRKLAVWVLMMKQPRLDIPGTENEEILIEENQSV